MPVLGASALNCRRRCARGAITSMTVQVCLCSRQQTAQCWWTRPSCGPAASTSSSMCPRLTLPAASKHCKCTHAICHWQMISNWLLLQLHASSSQVPTLSQLSRRRLMFSWLHSWQPRQGCACERALTMPTQTHNAVHGATSLIWHNSPDLVVMPCSFDLNTSCPRPTA